MKAFKPLPSIPWIICGNYIKFEFSNAILLLKTTTEVERVKFCEDLNCDKM